MKEIPLTKGMVAFVDDEDYERCAAHKWYASLESRGTKFYAIRWSKKSDGRGKRRVKIRLHHEVLGIRPEDLPPDYVVDHVNGNSLDCRKFIDGKIQLEVITQAQNMLRSPGWRKKAEEPWL